MISFFDKMFSARTGKWLFWIISLPFALALLMMYVVLFALSSVGIFLCQPLRLCLRAYPKFLAWYERNVP